MPTTNVLWTAALFVLIMSKVAVLPSTRLASTDPTIAPGVTWPETVITTVSVTPSVISPRLHRI